MAAHQQTTNDAMDLDVIDLSNTECYKCHKKGHISRNCKAGNKSSSTPHRKKPPGLMVMDLIPQFSDPTKDTMFPKSSQESKQNIDGSEDPDPRIELEDYKKSYLEAVENLDPSSILDHQMEAKVFAENSARVCCKSCYLFGCYDRPKSNYDEIVGKRNLESFDEDPTPDDTQDNGLFNIDLDIRDFQVISNKRKIDSIDGFEYSYDRSKSPDVASTFLKGEDELLNIETWNKVLAIGKQHRRKELTETLTDLEISVLESLQEDFNPEEQALTFGVDIKPGDSLTLNMSDLERTSTRSTYRPLPIYYFTHGKLTLRTILDTGAATNYISKETIKVLSKRQDSSVSVEDVEKQGVRLANGEREETSKLASLNIESGKYKRKISAFILNLPNVDLILGLPWYQAAKPVIDFGTNTYFIQQNTGIVPIRPEENGNDLPALCTNSMTGPMKTPIASESFCQIIKKEFPECFNEDIVVCDRPWKHSIDTGDARPIKTHGRPHTPVEHALVKQFVDDGLKQGIIETSSSPWSAPLILITKPDGSTRVCVDYRGLNAVTKKNAYPLPRIDDAYQFLSKSKFFSTLDLKSGFWQIQMEESDKSKTSFTCQYGHFQWKVMPFGLCNAPATFQTVMNGILAPFVDKFALVYLDDVIIYSNTEEEHQEHIRKVMSALAKHKLIVSEKKCNWFQKSLLFLGHIVDGDGIRTNPSKVDKIVNWPTPENITHVRGFLNLCTYYKRFIQGFSSIASPIYKLTQGSPKPGSKIQWDEEQQKSFELLKEKPASTVPLVHPLTFHPFVLDTDASGTNIGAVLQQDVVVDYKQGSFNHQAYAKQLKNGNLRPIAYESRKLSKTEQNYSAQERELLAIVHALKHFRGYIEGSPILVRTDHESLKHFKTQAQVNRRLARFVDEVEFFDCYIIYRPGKDQLAADSLSRKPNTTDDEETPETEPALFSISEECQDRFSELTRQKRQLLSGFDPELIGTGKSWTQNGRMWRREGDQDEGGIQQVICSYGEASSLAQNVHGDLGHRNLKDVLTELQKKYWFPSMGTIFKKLLSICEPCQIHSKPSHQQNLPLKHVPRGKPFMKWGLDFVGPLIKTANGHQFLVTAVDYGTGWAYANPIVSTSASAVILLIKEIIRNHGVPHEIMTDNGSEFLSRELKDYLKNNSIKHSKTSPYHPQANGLVERFHGTLMNALRKACSPYNQNLWDECLNNALFGYRVSFSSSMKCSPYFMVYGTDVRLPSDNLMMEPLDENIELIYLQRNLDIRKHGNTRQKLIDELNERTRLRYNNTDDSFTERRLRIGDLVLQKFDGRPTKLHPQWDGPFVIKEATPEGVYTLMTSNGHVLRMKYNGEKLKKYNGSNSDFYFASQELHRRDEAARRRR